MRYRANGASPLSPLSFRLLKRIDNVLINVMLWPDNNWPKRCVVPIGSSTVVHRNREEAGRTECFALGCDLLQVSAERLLSLVDATNNLKLRSS